MTPFARYEDGLSHRAWSLVPPIFVGLCLLLGGASVRGLPQNTILQLLGLAILVWATFNGRTAVIDDPFSRPAALFGVTFVALLLFQFVPLPPSVWTALPGRAPIVETLQLAGVELGWRPLTLSPSASLADSLKYLPPTALLASLLTQRDHRAMKYCIWVVVIVALISLMLGAIQLVQRNPDLYFYSITNFGAAVGFYSNTNHLATLLLVTIALLGSLIVSEKAQRRRYIIDHVSIIGLTIFLVASVSGIFLVNSRAGIGLLFPIIVGVGLLIWRIRIPVRANLVTVTAAFVLFLAASALLYWLFINNAGELPGSYERARLFASTVDLANRFFPFGSGLGTFSATFPFLESPDEVTSVFANHAHNDAIEIVATTGIFGLIMLALFLFGWCWRVVDIWSRAPEIASEARAASIASTAMLLHSLVDYPLRTAAGAALFALLLAIMFSPIGRRR